MTNGGNWDEDSLLVLHVLRQLDELTLWYAIDPLD